MSTTAVVLAGPERKRILRELLSLPEPWSARDRGLYSEMIWLECISLDWYDGLAEPTEEGAFADLVCRGVAVDRARELAVLLGQERLREVQRLPTAGQKERERRRIFRQAVTSKDGALAVTTGLVQTCITCGGPFYRSRLGRHPRNDSAYCSQQCRQRAYRQRVKAKA